MLQGRKFSLTCLSSVYKIIKMSQATNTDQNTKKLRDRRILALRLAPFYLENAEADNCGCCGRPAGKRESRVSPAWRWAFTTQLTRCLVQRLTATVGGMGLGSRYPRARPVCPQHSLGYLALVFGMQEAVAFLHSYSGNIGALISLSIIRSLCDFLCIHKTAS